MKKLRTFGVLAFMLFAIAGNAKAQINNDSEVVTTSTEAQVQDEGAKKNAIQPQASWDRKKYFNINLVTSETLAFKENKDAKSEKDFGIGITLGRTFYVLKQPIVNMVQVGIDWTYIDLTYTKYKKVHLEDLEDGDHFSLTPWFGDQHAQYSMAVGPSVTVNPINHLVVNAYLRYMPTCSAIFNDKKVNFAYASGCQFGMTAGWKAFQLGFETRSSSVKHKMIDNIDNKDTEGLDKDHKYKLKNKSFRFFIGFRF